MPDKTRTDQLFSESSELKRSLGFFDATMIVVGMVIGSGIFLTTGIMAESLPNPVWILAVWGIGGLLSLCGALTFAELGAMMPRAGGQYVFLREGFGDLAGFLFGWTYLLVVQSGSVAAIAVGFGEYFRYFFPFLPAAGTAIVVTLILSWINYRGVEESSLVQNVLTSAKILAILAIGGAGIYFLNWGPEAEKFAFQAPGAQFPALSAFGVAMIAVLWTFDGWNCVTFNAGEIKNPRRNLPWALILGTLTVTICYMILNYVYLKALPLEELAGTVRVAEAAISAIFSPTATVLIVLAVLVSTLGSVNACILTGPRIYYAMSRDRLFFRGLAEIHPRFGTPARAVLIQGVVSIIFALSGTYDQLFTMVMVAAMAFYGATGFSVFILRRKYPDAERSYKTPGYPVTPILYVGSTVLILLNSLVERPWESLWGCLIVLSGVPVYLYWKRRTNRA
ncbi:MAG: amino acid permease [Acidobacteriota bacterium]|nr:MAG: amino acid permease [Acidobacteriota bacterium]